MPGALIRIGTWARTLLRHGLLTANAGDNVVRLLPPLTTDETHVDEAMAALEAACGEIAA